MPKKRSGEKEKPLLTVQGVLRLEKSFVSPRHDDAEVMEVLVPGREEKKKILLIPGESEHDLVDYKAGYDVGPENPFPLNEPEEKIFREKEALRRSEEEFEKLKENSCPLAPPGEDEGSHLEDFPAPKAALEGKAPDSPEGKISGRDDESLLEKSLEVSVEERGKEGPNETIGHMALSVALEMEGKRKQAANQSPLDEDSRGSTLDKAEEPLERDSIPKDSTPTESIGNMVLSVALEMEEKRMSDSVHYSLKEMKHSKMEEEEKESLKQGPDISLDQLANSAREKEDYDGKALLASYWAFVKENPIDFNGWTYLIQQAETLDSLEDIRSVYNAFLPLYPYCYAYWIRYSDIEKKHENWQRSLAILHRGLQAIPLSVDLWLTYLELYRKLYSEHEKFDELFRTQCERAVSAVGLEYRSDEFWERYIEWEKERKNFRHITKIYRRLISIPTKLYNRHWDNLIAHIRDHHPRDILEYHEYEQLRRVTCEELELTYRPDPVIKPSDIRQVVQPEDKLKAGMKERIVAAVIGDHERTEVTVDDIYVFEEKIKRTYFHVRSLDSKQLKNWDSYLDYEMSKKNHERIIVLFERCLIPCANYEQFWIKYARYLESFLRSAASNEGSPNSMTNKQLSNLDLEKARWAFGTGLNTVDELKEKRCAWTLRGWKETDKDGNEVMAAAENPTQDIPSGISMDPCGSSKSSTNQYLKEAEKQSSEDVNKSFRNEIEKEMSSVLKTSWSNDTNYETVRTVYKRACLIHCSSRALVHLRWAAFEEESRNYQSAREIVSELLKKYPLLLECCMQLIDIERRLGNESKVDEMYKKLIKKIPQNRKNIKTWASMKYARYLFKVVGSPERALGVLRGALKRERGDPRLYSQIIDICYQRNPIDVPGFTAAIELALNASELSHRQKFEFIKRKVEFLQEFGDVKRYRDACDQLKTYRISCTQELKAEAKKKKELEKEEHKLKEVEEIRAKTRASANMKAKIAESEGRLMCTYCQKSIYPNAEGVYEFEKFRPKLEEEDKSSKQPNGAKVAEDEEEEKGVLDLLDMCIPEEQAEEIQKSLREKTKYKEVAPTWELNIETYGYGKRRKIYDPDYEHVESAKFKEYERLESAGYDAELKDSDCSKLKHMSTPGLGSDKTSPEDKPLYTSSDYIVPPKVPQLVMGPGIGPVKPNSVEEEENSNTPVFELPPEIADPQKSPCVNVPEWFVKEGGELCLSDTPNGISVIRYWPKFLSDKGNHFIFNRLRKYCKWHQKQVKIGGEWKYETRLVAWYGPCDYVYSGMSLEKNLNWAPELLDLLHRLVSVTNHDFNSCFANLYRHGHDMCGWHADVHPQLGRNPTVASVSLGVVRVFEFRKKTGPPNFIRFPLFPGSLLVMEGATQEDWLHCLPCDVNCKEERINLTFRTMYSIEKRS